MSAYKFTKDTNLLNLISEIANKYQDTIEKYTNEEYYRDFNLFCRNKKSSSYSEEFLKMKKDFEELFLQLPSLKSSLTVYRGVRNIQDCELIYTDMYISCSASIEQAFTFCGSSEEINSGNSELMEITIQRGCKVLMILKDNFSFGAESEVILNKGGELRKIGETNHIVLNDNVRVSKYIYTENTDGTDNKEDTKNNESHSLVSMLNSQIRDEYELADDSFSLNDTVEEFIKLTFSRYPYEDVENLKAYLGKANLSLTLKEYFELNM